MTEPEAMPTANDDQFEAWNGESGRRWAGDADRRDAVLSPIADLLLDIAAVGPGERVIDIGCGCGSTTLGAVSAAGPTGRALGIDLSAPMREVARARAAAVRPGNVEFRQIDAQTEALGQDFDVAISRFGTMFFSDPTAGFDNLARHLVRGGRLCIATWQPLVANEWLVVPGAALADFGDLPDTGDTAAPGMFAQSDPDRIRPILHDAGFIHVHVAPHDVELTVGSTVDEAVDYLASTGPGRAILDTIPEDRRVSALAEVRAALGPYARPPRGVVLGAAVLITTAVTGSAPA